MALVLPRRWSVLRSACATAGGGGEERGKVKFRGGGVSSRMANRTREKERGEKRDRKRLVAGLWLGSLGGAKSGVG